MVYIQIQCSLDYWLATYKLKRAGCLDTLKVVARPAHNFPNKLPIKPTHAPSFSLQTVSMETRINCVVLFRLDLFLWRAVFLPGICTPVIPTRSQVRRTEPARWLRRSYAVTCAWESAPHMDGTRWAASSV